MINRLRYAFYRWLFVQGGPVMVHSGGRWLYVDPYGVLWSLEPSYKQGMPFVIRLESQ